MAENNDDCAKFMQEQEMLLHKKLSRINLTFQKMAKNVQGASKGLEVMESESDLDDDDQEIIEAEEESLYFPIIPRKPFGSLNLNPKILEVIYSMGFSVPSKIQEATLPLLLADPPLDLIAQSESRTGKTTTLILAMLSRVDISEKTPQILYLTPSYESAIQTGMLTAHMIAKFDPQITMKYAVAGEEVSTESQITEQVIIGTPGKVLDWGLKFRTLNLEILTVFIVDEGDEMFAAQGHADKCIRIHKALSPDCQLIFFSPITNNQEIMEFAKALVPNAPFIRLKKEQECLDFVEQYYVICGDPAKKFTAITNICSVLGGMQTIIFCRQSKRMAKWLTEKLSESGISAGLFTGDTTNEQRIDVLDLFKRGVKRALVGTSALTREINVPQVTVVFNYHLPVNGHDMIDFDKYLYRIGRTGSLDKRGIAINLIDSKEEMNIILTIQKHFDREIKHLDAYDYNEVVKLFH